MIRRAAIADVPEMGRIINDAAEYGLMLHRSQAYLFEHVRDFHVAGDDTSGGVIGVCGLNIVWSNLAEIYALAVGPSARGRGLGSLLVEACVEEARQLGIARLMSLTYEKRFFERLHFTVVDRHTLPHKVWSQCIHCAKHDACDEIAMIRELDGVEEIKAPIPQSPPYHEEDIPVPITIGTRQVDGPRRKMDELHE